MRDCRGWVSMGRQRKGLGGTIAVGAEEPGAIMKRHSEGAGHSKGTTGILSPSTLLEVRIFMQLIFSNERRWRLSPVIAGACGQSTDDSLATRNVRSKRDTVSVFEHLGQPDLRICVALLG